MWTKSVSLKRLNFSFKNMRDTDASLQQKWSKQLFMAEVQSLLQKEGVVSNIWCGLIVSQLGLQLKIIFLSNNLVGTVTIKRLII